MRRGVFRTYTRVQKREEAEGVSESNRVVCSANDAWRCDDFLPRRMNAKVSYKLADSLTDTFVIMNSRPIYFYPLSTACIDINFLRIKK